MLLTWTVVGRTHMMSRRVLTPQHRYSVKKKLFSYVGSRSGETSCFTPVAVYVSYCMLIGMDFEHLLIPSGWTNVSTLIVFFSCRYQVVFCCFRSQLHLKSVVVSLSLNHVPNWYMWYARLVLKFPRAIAHMRVSFLTVRQLLSYWMVCQCLCRASTIAVYKAVLLIFIRLPRTILFLFWMEILTSSTMCSSGLLHANFVSCFCRLWLMVLLYSYLYLCIEYLNCINHFSYSSTQSSD